MGARHRARTSRSNLVVGSIAASVGVSSVLAAAIVELVAPDEPAAVSAPSPQGAQPSPPSLSQQGRVVSVSPDSLTTQSADGIIQTFALTPATTAITGDGQAANPVASFTVNDEVTVVGERRGSAVVATAVADTAAVGAQGPPMDYGL